MSTKKNNKQKGDIVTISLKWQSGSELPTLYANQLLVSHASGEFYLIFGESSPPLVSPNEEIPKSIDIIPKAKVVVLPENMEKFLEVLQINIERYKKQDSKILIPKNSNKTVRNSK